MRATVGARIYDINVVNAGATGDVVPFTPTDLSSLEAWFDASDTDSITESGTGVSQWDDKSGNDYHVSQATDANRPSNGDTINGNNAIDFNGTTDHLSRSTGSALTDVFESPYTLSVAVQVDAANVAGIIVGSGNTSSDTPLDWLMQVDAGLNTWRTNRRDNIGPSGQTADFGTVDTSPHVLTVVFDGSSKTTYLDGVLTGSGVSITQNPSILETFAIGAAIRTSLSSPFNGSIGEVIVASSALSGSDLTNLNTYMTNKWLP